MDSCFPGDIPAPSSNGSCALYLLKRRVRIEAGLYTVLKGQELRLSWLTAHQSGSYHGAEHEFNQRGADILCRDKPEIVSDCCFFEVINGTMNWLSFNETPPGSPKMAVKRHVSKPWKKRAFYSSNAYDRHRGIITLKVQKTSSAPQRKPPFPPAAPRAYISLFFPGLKPTPIFICAV